jgi:glycosyltransferase involved in cell wall biosynthesis
MLQTLTSPHAEHWFTDDGGIPPEVAVLLPCRNEETAIATVVTDFTAALPDATIYVYDNDSVDATAILAREAGAQVRHVSAPGKGNVIRRMFAEVEATCYVICDGDGTYDVASVVAMVDHLRRHKLDMVVGRRVEHDQSGAAYRTGHRLGNRLLSGSVRRIFGNGPSDMLSGYRVLSRRYVKSFPAASTGFETETEMTVHALDLSLAFDELPTPYQERPDESASKLRTIPDGIRILRFILRLCKDYRPFLFFGTLSAVCALGALSVAGFSRSSELSSWTPQLAVSLGLLACALALFLAGAVADALGRRGRELKRILFLSVPERSTTDRQPPLGVERTR